MSYKYSINSDVRDSDLKMSFAKDMPSSKTEVRELESHQLQREKEDERLYYLDWARGLAIHLVVVIHVIV